MRPAPAPLRCRMRTMFASTAVAARKISVLVVGESRHPFSLFQPLENISCQWQFVKSHQEATAILSQTAPDIMITTYTHRIHAEMMALLTGLRVTLFYVLPVEEGCWCLPVLRNGENCFGTPAFRPREFTYVLADIVRSMKTATRSNERVTV
jgi:hypothetical protein